MSSTQRKRGKRPGGSLKQPQSLQQPLDKWIQPRPSPDASAPTAPTAPATPLKADSPATPLLVAGDVSLHSPDTSPPATSLPPMDTDGDTAVHIPGSIVSGWLEAQLARVVSLLYNSTLGTPEAISKEILPLLSADCVWRLPWMQANSQESCVRLLALRQLLGSLQTDVNQLSVDLNFSQDRARCLLDSVQTWRPPSNLFLAPLRWFVLPRELRFRVVTVLELDVMRIDLQTRKADFFIREVEEIWSVSEVVGQLPFGVGALFRRALQPAVSWAVADMLGGVVEFRQKRLCAVEPGK